MELIKYFDSVLFDKICKISCSGQTIINYLFSIAEEMMVKTLANSNLRKGWK